MKDYRKTINVGGLTFQSKLFSNPSIFKKVDSIPPDKKISINLKDVKHIENLVQYFEDGSIKTRFITNYNVLKKKIFSQVIRYNLQGDMIYHETKRYHPDGMAKSASIYSHYDKVNDKWTWKSQNVIDYKKCKLTNKILKHRELYVKRNQQAQNIKMVELKYNQEGKLLTGASKKNLTFYPCGSYKDYTGYVFNNLGKAIKTVTIKYELQEQ